MVWPPPPSVSCARQRQFPDRSSTERLASVASGGLLLSGGWEAPCSRQAKRQQAKDPLPKPQGLISQIEGLRPPLRYLSHMPHL